MFTALLLSVIFAANDPVPFFKSDPVYGPEVPKHEVATHCKFNDRTCIDKYYEDVDTSALLFKDISNCKGIQSCINTYTFIYPEEDKEVDVITTASVDNTNWDDIAEPVCKWIARIDNGHAMLLDNKTGETITLPVRKNWKEKTFTTGCNNQER